jgi:hypothetical protein
MQTSIAFCFSKKLLKKIKASKESKSLEARSFLFNYRNNLCDKFAFIFMFGFGIVLDYFFPYVLSLIAIELPFNSPLGMIIATYIVLTESISICENFYRIDKDSFPSWIAKMLSLAKEDINLGNNEDNSQDGE